MWSSGDVRSYKQAYRVLYDTEAKAYRCEGLSFNKWIELYTEPTETNGVIRMDVWARTIAEAVEIAYPAIEAKVRSMSSGEKS